MASFWGWIGNPHAVIEGKRGMPMPKPPFPAQSGLNGKPTVINNVETLASVPLILSWIEDQGHHAEHQQHTQEQVHVQPP